MTQLWSAVVAFSLAYGHQLTLYMVAPQLLFCWLVAYAYVWLLQRGLS